MDIIKSLQDTHDSIEIWVYPFAGLDYWTGLLDSHKICSNTFFQPQTPFSTTNYIEYTWGY